MLVKRNLPLAERLEGVRNIKYYLLNIKTDPRRITMRDIEQICGGGLLKGECDFNRRVSFVGFVNEFDDVFGKNCVYIHLDDTEEKEWLAERAVRHGALAVITERQIGDLPCIIVDNVWDTLVELSRWYYQKNSTAATVIAGSIGKTTSKEMVECVYKQRFHTFCTPTNGNVLAYLAYEILHMPKKVEQFVQEIDESYPNNAEKCSYVLQPEIAIITTIDKSHISTIGGEVAVRDAIVDVTKHMPLNGTVIINSDDPGTAKAVFHQNIVRVAIQDTSADYFASNIICSDTSVDFVINSRSESVPIHLNCPGKHNVYNAMFAYAAGKLNGMSNDQIQKGLASYRPMTIRQTTYHSLGKTLYVDCYNASAKSIAAALDVVNTMVPRLWGRRVAVIGDIAEIEGYENEVYREIADKISQSEIDYLITYGKDSQSIQGFMSNPIEGKHFTEEKDLIMFLKKKLRFGDVVLFKASHSANLEHVVKKVFPLPYYWGKIPYWAKLGKWFFITI